MPRDQHTIAKPITCEGIGIHTGKIARVEICPADPDTGIVFERTDLQDKDNVVHAVRSFVTDSTRCTTLANAQGASVKTVEHLLAALYATGIDNAVIKINAPEVPILDGSADKWCTLISEAGRQRQEKPQKTLRILKPVTVRDGKRWLSIEPSDDLVVDIKIDYPHQAVGEQQASFDTAKDDFTRTIARAKTFVFQDEIDALKKGGLGNGGTLENTIVLGDNGVMNPEILSYPDNELARHKVLDIIGDVSLAGMPVAGKITGSAPGHALTHELMSALFREKGAWEIVTQDQRVHFTGNPSNHSAVIHSHR